jgi:hypothetical protein
LAIGLAMATELEHPLLVPYVSHSRPRDLTSDESMLLAEALAFLEGLWRETRSPHSMAVWRVERWLRDHRLTIAQFQEFLAREKAVPHPIEDCLDGALSSRDGRSFWCMRPGSNCGAGRREPANGSARTTRRRASLESK